MTWFAAHVIAYALFALALCWRLVAAASLERLRISRLYEPAPGEDWPIFTLLCPLYREATSCLTLSPLWSGSIGQSTRWISNCSLKPTTWTLWRRRWRPSHEPHFEVVLIPASKPRTKPKALNVGLGLARGDYVGVYDAEDRPHPVQLRAAAQAFGDGGATLACVQAPLVIDNAGASWLAQQFAAEYAIQFREMLPLLARLGLPLPLGGSSNHFRADALRAVGGWDAYNVTEDADLGFRLAREGYNAQPDRAADL